MSSREYFHTPSTMGIASELGLDHDDVMYPYAGQERYHVDGKKVTFDCYSLFLSESDYYSIPGKSVSSFTDSFPKVARPDESVCLHRKIHIHSKETEDYVKQYFTTDILPMFFDNRKRVYRGNEALSRIAHCAGIIDENRQSGNCNEVIKMAAALLRPIIADVISQESADDNMLCDMVVGQYGPSWIDNFGVLQVQMGDYYCDVRLSKSTEDNTMFLVAHYGASRDSMRESAYSTPMNIKEKVSNAEDVVRALMPFVMDAAQQA